MKETALNKVKSVNKDILDSIRKDRTKLAKMRQPCVIFLTFEYEEGFNRACDYNETVRIQEMRDEMKQYRRFLGRKFHVYQAPEPSDIIWENIDNDMKKRRIR